MLVSSAINVYYTKSANDIVEETQRLMLEGRKIANLRGNTTLNAIADVILDFGNVEKNILGNLTDHRLVANFTRDQVLNIQNDTQRLITEFNATNEEQRSRAVKDIVIQINNKTSELIDQLSEENQN